MPRLSHDRSLFFLLIAFILTCAVGCRPAKVEKNNDSPESPKQVEKINETHFSIKLGEKTISIEVALTDREQAKGLMNRKTLKPDTGMLFLYPKPQTMSFWMKNTYIPLDVGFFRPSGELWETYPMFPHDENPVRSRNPDILFALEMEQGWFSANHIRPGARLDIDKLKSILKKRGFNPENYAFEE